ncbi:MAG TPA: 2Fe-2S iron-sulfur cluster-binding protein [Solirubrobacteraceae bacterium]|nr:2Fe-2S iron-sulfur cluster-binding protein [Solirubrobacteraceae bacterium]
MARLPPQPAERIEREREISFTFDGRVVRAFEGDTIGSALFAAGRRTFSRSFKYHRRRGLLCCSGSCPNCLVAVDGAPGARACTEPARDGISVKHLNATPSLELDVMSLTDAVGGPFTPPGFYYRTFMRPRRLWPLYEWVLRHAAGLGRLERSRSERAWRTEYRRRHADVLVVGGGHAGLAAAIAAAELGADVVLADEGREPGGRLLWEGGHELARALAERARAAGVEVLRSAPALAHFDGLVPVWQGDTLHQVRARLHVYATGAIEQPLVFERNDLPGVMLSGGARRLAALYALRPGERAVIATTCDRGLAAALALQEAGVEIAAVADARGAPSAAVAELEARGIETLQGWTVTAAHGRRAVTRATLAPLASAGARAAEASGRTLECDLIVVSGGDAPASALVAQAGARAAYDGASGQFVLAELPRGVFAAGELAGDGAPERVAASGELAGLEAAAALDASLADVSRERMSLLREQLASAHEPAPAGAAPAARAHDELPAPAHDELPAPNGARAFVCYCEDVTAKDIGRGVREGYDSIELCKRFTTVTMGPCQGRMCQRSSVGLIARETGQELDAVGTPTARPPWAAVPLGVLAGRPIEPAKRSSIHGRHRELGARVQWAGDWRRAYDYGDPEGEALAVHASAGLIDVSTLGKLLVRGPDAGEFLDRLYTNRISTLKPGRVRYGVLTSDAGRIIDDGTIGRLDEATFYVTTTSSGAGAVEQWFSWWLADWGLGVHLSDVTQALAAVNLAGPRSRAILSRLTDLDCAPEAFTYLDARQGRVAGVGALLLRIGFVGELGYEIHFPAAYGEHVWDAILAAGEPEEIRPFGLEPQRILRLQKQHILVGQDTDSESTPLGAALGWAVKLDKDEDFIGKWALAHTAEHPAPSALVGFTLPDGFVPTEGAVVLDGSGAVAGQVTSARRSRQLGCVIGMAWVPAALAGDGASVTIADNGTRVSASVVTEPFHDPAGELLRS